MSLPAPLRDALADLLACPRCGGALEPVPSEPSDEPPRTPAVRCTGCRSLWPVREGVLDFLSAPGQEGESQEGPP